MNETDSGTIERRLAHLEQVVNRGQLVIAGLAILLVLLIAWNVAGHFRVARPTRLTARELVVRRLSIVDERGNSRIALWIAKDGANVRLLDEKGTARVSLAVTKVSNWCERV